MASEQRQARALGEPSRHRLFHLLVQADAPQTVAQLAGHVDLHPNAIRQHLSVLVAAGVVHEDTAAPSGRGRPSRLYSVEASARARWGGVGPYERLAVMLAEAVETGDAPRDVGRRAGAEAASRSPRTSGDGFEALMVDLERNGFAPSAVHHGLDATITLGSCPFVAAVQAQPAVVCELHHGLAQGVASAVGGLVVESLDRRDPTLAGCQLRCRRVAV